MKNSTKSKPSMVLDTATKKSSRWFRIGSHRGEIDQLFDLYWGGKERRITGMTLRIMGVNVLALFALIFGVVYLGQYHSALVEAKLERFETEILMVSVAVSEGAFSDESQDSIHHVLMKDKADLLVSKLALSLNSRILIFDERAQKVLDSDSIIQEQDIEPVIRIIKDEERALQSVEILKNTAAWVASFFPEYDRLPRFSGVRSDSGLDYSDVVDAQNRKLSMSAWRGDDDEVVLTAAMPLLSEDKRFLGTVYLVSGDKDIRKALGDAWFGILRIFLVTLLVTIFLSIYLSGVIARPLRKLASAAENVRKGKLKHTEIPDMSGRYDEIGELSLVLRDMTHALWERMDTIESFAADVAHEIKNPLTSLKSAVETARVVKKKEDMEKLLGIIQHDIERLDRLITDISSASRLDAELSRETFEVIDLKQVLRHFLDAYKGPLERDVAHKENSDEALKDGVLITLDMPDVQSELMVRGSEGRLIQVFQNLVANALSFSKVKSQIKIGVKVKAKRITITIDDEGPGIPESKLKSIFDRFYSERPEHEEYGRHSGLGLSICKQIITAHNGVIYAENRKDRSNKVMGARFVVILNKI